MKTVLRDTAGQESICYSCEMTDGDSVTWNSSDKKWWSKANYSDIRDNPVPLKDKRRLREMSQTEDCRASLWIRWTPKYCLCLRPVWGKVLQVLAAFKLWEKTLIAIRGRFGSSISSYFSFLRLLMVLNFASLILTTGLVIFPTMFLNQTEHHQGYFAPCGNSSSSLKSSIQNILLDIFTGEGFMENTFIFYGHYTDVDAQGTWFNIRLAYLLTPLVFLLICSFGLLQCTVKGITQRRVRSRDYNTSISNKVFSGWDYCVRGPGTSILKQQSLSNDIKSHLAEDRWFWELAEQSFGERVRVLVLRVLLNCIILALIAGGFYSIYLAADIAQYYQERPADPILSLVKEYLVPIVISLVLLILPHFFMLLVRFEGLSPSAEITLTLIRCVFLRLGVLGIFFFSLGRKILCFGGSRAPCETCGYNTHFQCWETSVGQEFYKLSIFHFLQLLMVFLSMQLPRRFLISRSQCRVVRWLGKEKFHLSQNVLDTVYGQTLVWGGMFYAPLLPLVNLIFIFITFYIKKFSLYRLCDVSQKLFRESTLRILFHFVLLLGLMTVFFPVIYLVTSVRPSRSCGLFADYNTPWEAVQNSTRSALSPIVLTALRYMTSDTTAYCLLTAMCLMLTSYVCRVRQNEQDVEQLKVHLSSQIEDKEFLVQRLREEQDRQKHNQIIS
ncbi:transmembrane channel-like protein 8 isoform X2 [Mixophyes fleayi]|uniref:transmembrane channel-like protein 8 isoform X2 n=1 Tax=Mixophyes fleayi TaxID=3061075 RepID=UPI003F4DA5DA